MNLAVFYHTLFVLGNPPAAPPRGIAVVSEQMDTLKRSGLLEAASECYIGINGGEESRMYADCLLPESAVKVYHGLQCQNELRTLMLLQQVMAGRKGWLVLYFHTKGFTHDLTEELIFNWRRCMMTNLVTQWEGCVSDLESGVDSVGCHWKTRQVDGRQSLWGGNFWWAKSDFLHTLPPIEKHPRIPVMGGIDAFASRYEAEVWIGTGKRLPRVLDYHPSGPFTCGQ
jgi:hypothetical protein